VGKRKEPVMNRTLTLAVAAVLLLGLVVGLGWSFSTNGNQTPSVAKPSWLVLSSTR
jgi:hypothetical protein